MDEVCPRKDMLEMSNSQQEADGPEFCQKVSLWKAALWVPTRTPPSRVT